MPRIALLSCSCTMQTILRTCAVTKTDQIGGKLTLVLERGKGSGLLGLLSRGKGSGRAEDGSEAGDSLHLGKSCSIQQNWGGRRRQATQGSGRKNRVRLRASVTAIFASIWEIACVPQSKASD